MCKQMIDIGKKQEGGVRREVPMCCLFKTASLKNILNSTNLLLRIICDAHLSLLIEQQNDFFDRDKQVLTLSQGNFYLGSRKKRLKNPVMRLCVPALQHQRCQGASNSCTNFMVLFSVKHEEHHLYCFLFRDWWNGQAII